VVQLEELALVRRLRGARARVANGIGVTACRRSDRECRDDRGSARRSSLERSHRFEATYQPPDFLSSGFLSSAFLSAGFLSSGFLSSAFLSSGFLSSAGGVTVAGSAGLSAGLSAAGAAAVASFV